MQQFAVGLFSPMPADRPFPSNLNSIQSIQLGAIA
jgi:hypothetical protein